MPKCSRMSLKISWMFESGSFKASNIFAASSIKAAEVLNQKNNFCIWGKNEPEHSRQLKNELQGSHDYFCVENDEWLKKIEPVLEDLER